MPSVKGDFATLTQWAAVLDSGDALLAPMSRSMAEEALDLVKEGFRNAEDPYGDEWAPKQENDGRRPLHGKTSRLRTGWHVVQSGPGEWIIAPNVDYAAPHQAPRRNPVTGRLRRPRRMMVPTAERGLPPSWSASFTEVALDTLNNFFGNGSKARFDFVAGRVHAARRQMALRSLIRRAMSAGDDE